MRSTNTLHGLRQAVEEMAAAGSSLDDISTAIVDSTAGLDAERRAVLWLYARACTEAAGGQGEMVGTGRSDSGRVHASGRPSEPGAASQGRRRRMPYTRCPNCGLTTYATLDRAGASECPSCGEPLWADERPGGAGSPPGVGGNHVAAVDGALELAREQLDMDIALLTEIADGRETVRAEAGEWPPLGSLTEGSIPIEESFCKRLLEGRITNAVPDAATDERVRDLAMARDFGVGAWIGVPLTLADARLYMLCCLAREARPALGDEEVRFLSGLGESVRAELEGAASG